MGSPADVEPHEHDHLAASRLKLELGQLDCPAPKVEQKTLVRIGAEKLVRVVGRGEESKPASS
jgi:hypothetical protein